MNSQYSYQRLLQEQALIESANVQMENIAKNLLASGIVKTIEDAAIIACKEHGRQMAGLLQESLRKMGAKDIIITCP
jgi:hypothetical protein